MDGKFITKRRFLAGTHNASYTNYSFFIDDNIQYKRLTLRPGVRLDRDDFVQKTTPTCLSATTIFGAQVIL